MAGKYRSLYGRKWRVRRAHQLAHEPLCRMCRAHGRVTPARVADHIVPHRGDAALFWHGELQSLCDACHSSAKQREEIAEQKQQDQQQPCGADGYPVGGDW